MPRIFITYRRDDTSIQAARLYDSLEEHYGRDAVFKDFDSIDPGRPWRQAIDSAISSSEVVIALIGPRWLPELEERSGADDFVRCELETALAKDRRIIPLLVNGAVMPAADQLPEELKALAEYQAFEVSEARYRSDVDELLRRLDRVVERPVDTTPIPRPGAEYLGLEAELKKWNWGAFLLTFVWGIWHGVGRSLLVLVPLYGLYEWFILGLNGNRWAWEKRGYESVERFHQSQRSWAKAGIIVTIVVFLILVASSG